MKTSLMTYCQRAHAAAMASETYCYAVGFEMGITTSESYSKNELLSKYQKIVVFPPNIDLLPVAIFTLGVTWRLVTARVCSSLLRGLQLLTQKSRR